MGATGPITNNEVWVCQKQAGKKWPSVSFPASYPGIVRWEETPGLHCLHMRLITTELGGNLNHTHTYTDDIMNLYIAVPAYRSVWMSLISRCFMPFGSWVPQYEVWSPRNNRLHPLNGERSLYTVTHCFGEVNLLPDTPVCIQNNKARQRS